MRENVCYKYKHLEKNNKDFFQLHIVGNSFVQNHMVRRKIIVHTHKTWQLQMIFILFLHFYFQGG